MSDAELSKTCLSYDASVMEAGAKAAGIKIPSLRSQRRRFREYKLFRSLPIQQQPHHKQQLIQHTPFKDPEHTLKHLKAD